MKSFIDDELQIGDNFFIMNVWNDGTQYHHSRINFILLIHFYITIAAAVSISTEIPIFFCVCHLFYYLQLVMRYTIDYHPEYCLSFFISHFIVTDSNLHCFIYYFMYPDAFIYIFFTHFTHSRKIISNFSNFHNRTKKISIERLVKIVLEHRMGACWIQSFCYF